MSEVLRDVVDYPDPRAFGKYDETHLQGGIDPEPDFLKPSLVGTFHPAETSATQAIPEPVQVLRNQAEQYRLLRPNEEVKLAKGIERGNLEDKELFINSNLRLVLDIAREYRGFGLDPEELVQNGLIGLIRAVEKFDYRKGTKFSTYATRWIRNEILRPVDITSCTAEVPRTVAHLQRKVTRAENKLTGLLGREPTDAELAAEINIEQSELDEFRQQTTPALRLDQPASADSETALGELLPEQSDVTVFDEVVKRGLFPDIASGLQDAAVQAIEFGPEVISFRYGFVDGGTHSAVETAEWLGISQSRVEYIERKVFEHFRRMERIRQHAA